MQDHAKARCDSGAALRQPPKIIWSLLELLETCLFSLPEWNGRGFSRKSRN
jgi:hypothetical protein